MSGSQRMGSDRRNRKRRPARGAPNRTVKRRPLIVCEGEVTEPEYFRGFERWRRNHTVQIDIPIKRSQGLALVERATRLKYVAESAARREADAFLGYDEVWCTFDVDENDNRNLNEARQLAGTNGIDLAVSNPCFEQERLAATLAPVSTASPIPSRGTIRLLRRHRAD